MTQCYPSGEAADAGTDNEDSEGHVYGFVG